MRWILLSMVALAACSKGPNADLPSISQARSLAAEWALVNELAAEGKVTPTYAEAMRKSVHEQLKTALLSMPDRNSQFGERVTGLLVGLLVEPQDASPQRLRGYADGLKQIEDSLESA